MTNEEPDTESDDSGVEESEEIEEGERGDSDSGLTILEKGHGIEEGIGQDFLEAASAS